MSKRNQLRKAIKRGHKTAWQLVVPVPSLRQLNKLRLSLRNAGLKPCIFTVERDRFIKHYNKLYMTFYRHKDTEYEYAIHNHDCGASFEGTTKFFKL